PSSRTAPVRGKAPSVTPWPRRAPGSTTAVGWMRVEESFIAGLPAWGWTGSFAGSGAEHLGAGDHLAVDLGLAVVHGHVADDALDLHVQLQHVARHHLLAEAGVLHLDHVEQLGL